MIYVFFYPSSIFLNKYLQPIFEIFFLVQLPIETSFEYIFNIPTAIWSFCFIYSLLLISYNINWPLYLAICLIIVPEFMQHPEIDYINGTFDIKDLLMNSIGIITALYLGRKFKEDPVL